MKWRSNINLKMMFINNTIDEFEENNLLDEIDNRYNFEPRSSILDKK